MTVYMTVMDGVSFFVKIDRINELARLVPTRGRDSYQEICAVSSVVEQCFYTAKVGGSNPSPRTK